MKLSYSVTSLILGLSVAAVIILLVRRNQLHARFALWWLAVAGASVLLGMFPRLIDNIARLAGVHYPPTLLMVAGLALVLIKMLTMDLEWSKQERDLRLLTQRLAIFEGRHEHCVPVSHQLDRDCEKQSGELRKTPPLAPPSNDKEI